jgi:hypothetical protein
MGRRMAWEQRSEGLVQNGGCTQAPWQELTKKKAQDEDRGREAVGELGRW